MAVNKFLYLETAGNNVLYLKDLSELLDIIESLTKDVASKLILDHQDDMNAYAKSAQVEERTDYITTMLKTKFARVSFEEAQQIISEHSQLPKVRLPTAKRSFVRI